VTTLTDIPEIRYARSGDLNIAYQRFGSGPDVVIIPRTSDSARNVKEAVWNSYPPGDFAHRLP